MLGQDERLKLTWQRERNNTYCYGDPTACPESDTQLACSVRLGGILDKERSSSWWSASSFDALKTAHEWFPYDAADIPGIETMRINSSLTLSNFPIGIFSFGIARDSTPIQLLGLGRNSTLLNRLSSAGLIASRTWGYYQGWTGAETQHQLDGSLVLGGYDEAKTIGQSTNISFSDDINCPSGLLVTVRGIKMNLLNGTELSIFGSSAGSAMNACLRPSLPIMNFPAHVWDLFVQFTGVDVLGRSKGINFWAMLISGNGSLVSFYRWMM